MAHQLLLLAVAAAAAELAVAAKPDGNGRDVGVPRAIPVGLRIVNNCNEAIHLRTPHMEQVSQDDSDGDYEVIESKASKSFPPGAVRHNRVVLAWLEAEHIKCHNGVFCNQIELTNPPSGLTSDHHPNFVNQLAFLDMPIGAAFFWRGQINPKCPQSVAPHCNASWCRSTQGKFDKCMHDMSRCTPDVGWMVRLSPTSKHQYCLSPDVNKAGISVALPNPTKARCAQIMSARWHCLGNCQDLTKTTTGTTDTLCGPRYDILNIMERPHENLTNLTNVRSGVRLTRQEVINNPFGGAKPYQYAVNSACGNQAPTQRAKLDPISRLMVPDWTSAYDRNFDKPGYLDHAVTWEADDANMWELYGQKYPNRGLFMAGSGGMQCDLPQQWDTFVIKACPLAAD